jgi:agmatinase
MRRVADIIGPRSLVQIGVRAGSRDEWTVARTVARYCASQLEIPTRIWTWLEDRPLYVSIDIDAVDPSAAPDTGNQEPEGLAASDVLTLARRLGDLRVVGLDLVEVSPPLDPPGRTAVLAAVILREAILSIGPHLALRRGDVLTRSVAPDSLKNS